MYVLFQVTHSQKLNETPAKAWVIVGNEGDVKTGHCDCKAGLDECCSHITAILYSILGAVKILTETTCTSLPNAWYASSGGNAEMAESSNILFVKPKRQLEHVLATGELPIEAKVKTRFIPPPTQEDLKEYHQMIRPLGKCAVLSVTPESAKDFEPKSIQSNFAKSVMDLYSEEHLQLGRPELLILAEDALPNISVTEEQVTN